MLKADETTSVVFTRYSIPHPKVNNLQKERAQRINLHHMWGSKTGWYKQSVQEGKNLNSEHMVILRDWHDLEGSSFLAVGLPLLDSKQGTGIFFVARKVPNLHMFELHDWCHRRSKTWQYIQTN